MCILYIEFIIDCNPIIMSLDLMYLVPALVVLFQCIYITQNIILFQAEYFITDWTRIICNSHSDCAIIPTKP